MSEDPADEGLEIQQTIPDTPGECEAVSLDFWTEPKSCSLVKRLPRGLAAAAEKDMLSPAEVD
jgi:hypothetical protein